MMNYSGNYEAPTLNFVSFEYNKDKMEKLLADGKETASGCSGSCCYAEGKDW